MKKQYMKPEMQVVKMKAEANLLVGSVGELNYQVKGVYGETSEDDFEDL